ncbi:CrcB protein [Bacillus ectoiniformans]|uniref:fluoride efflux transporter CrcB n=1 Tax=Bacillus ectoiniformans TaxID=1494429 RepID=UPI00195D3B7D|nr:fluoride efflux transporter CrcB [Bacillus ectoiniformans]MBM7647305.1 CrcB protein [Bacillus ectoiniformans]
MALLLTAAGGAVGALLRYAASLLLAKVKGSFPLGALTVNLLGSFLLGLFISHGQGLSIEAQLFIGTGLLGGFTTFSTFSVEGAALLEKKRSTFLIYVLFTILGSTLSFAAGMAAS